MCPLKTPRQPEPGCGDGSRDYCNPLIQRSKQLDQSGFCISLVFCKPFVTTVRPPVVPRSSDRLTPERPPAGCEARTVSDRFMTYPELAEFLGRSEEAARQLAKRRRWRRVISNEDGRARVAVPVEFLEAPRPPVEPRPTDQSSPDQPEDDQEDVLTIVALLRGQIARLEDDLEKARDGLDEARASLEVERIRAAQVDVLQALLEIERKHVALVTEDARQRADELRQDRDRWAGIAEAQQRQNADLMNAKARRGWWPFRRSA